MYFMFSNARWSRLHDINLPQRDIVRWNQLKKRIKSLKIPKAYGKANLIKLLSQLIDLISNTEPAENENSKDLFAGRILSG